jgi:hypothetical protein
VAVIESSPTRFTPEALRHILFTWPFARAKAARSLRVRAKDLTNGPNPVEVDCLITKI